MSRNRDRLGGPASTADAPAPAVMQDTNMGGFSFVTPTEFVELPSEGKYYPDDHPLCGETSIEIRQMTAKDEDLLTSKTLIKKGIALDRFIQNLVVDKSINTDTLLIGDRNAIVIAARVTGYGNDYTLKVSCPSCEKEQKYVFDLNEAEVTFGDIESAKNLKTVSNGDHTFDVKLPKSRVTVTFRLFNGHDEKRVIETLTTNKKKSQNNTVTDQLKSLLTAVEGDTSPATIEYFVDNMPSFDSRHLRMVLKIVTPNIDLAQHFECLECDFEQKMEVPFTTEFFWPE
jgi:hypothetical protein